MCWGSRGSADRLSETVSLKPTLPHHMPPFFFFSPNRICLTEVVRFAYMFIFCLPHDSINVTEAEGMPVTLVSGVVPNTLSMFGKCACWMSEWSECIELLVRRACEYCPFIHKLNQVPVVFPVLLRVPVSGGTHAQCPCLRMTLLVLHWPMWYLHVVFVNLNKIISNKTNPSVS